MLLPKLIFNVQPPIKRLEYSFIMSAQVKLSKENKGNNVKPDVKNK